NVLQSTFHSMAEAVLVIDADGNVLLSNPAASRNSTPTRRTPSGMALGGWTANRLPDCKN
ncbi:PAS domain-containing protein, partial [Bradyrhizobium sp. PRIMUS42]|uniref:PAS domain-containing protein n=1 Tax=Bradyrhizobium sp. PRIMUS42 TaxID=2908926 RepID=UPI001FF6F356